MVKTNSAVEKGKALLGDGLPPYTDDVLRLGYMAIGDYQKIISSFKEKSKIFQMPKVVNGHLEYDRTQKKLLKGETYLLRFNGLGYNEQFISDILACIEPTVRIEHVILDGKDDDGKDIVVNAMILIDARGNCGVVGYINDTEPDDELGNIEYETIGTIEEMITNTFDPFDF